ncbi:hypothetical protein N9926_00975 [Flavobacteriaceae bacterium]|nr:hypothetical protein [Flavobacteriaceae bacterium]
MAKISEVISRIRGQVKAEVQDAFVTDRYVYSLIIKYAQVLMRRQDFANKLMKFNAVWKTLPYVQLIDVDRIEASCSGIQSGCTFKRSKEKLPNMIEGYWGPLIRTLSSIDGSIEMQATQPGTYTSMTKTTSFKYNTTKYWWYINGYIYIPNVEWDAIKIEGVFDDNIGAWLCEEGAECIPRYEQEINIPEALFAEIEAQVINAMMVTVKIPVVDGDNKVDINR